MRALRVRAGHVLVKSRDDLSQAGRSTVLFSPGSPTRGIYFAEVLALGAGVDEVKVGDVVLVQAMSAPPGWPELEGDFFGDAVNAKIGDRLSLVPVLKRTPPAQRREEEFALRYKRLEACRLQWPGRKPPKIAAQMDEDAREMRVIRATRKGRARSRLLNWVREGSEGGVAEGVLAVVEPD